VSEHRPSEVKPPPAPFRSRLRMVYLLLAVFTFVALAPLCSVAWRLIDGNREALKTSQLEYAALLASTISMEVDTHVAGLRAQLVRGSHSLGVTCGRGGGDDDRAIRRVLDEVVDERMRYLRFTDLHGRVVSSTTTERIPVELEPSFLAGFRATAESLADGHRIGAESVTHADPLLLAGDPQRAALVLTAPVFGAGRYLGVVSAFVDLQSIWDMVVAGHSREPHTFFAVDAKGRLFASKDLPGVKLGRDMTDSEIVKRFRVHRGGLAVTMPFDWAPRRNAPVERFLGSYGVSREDWGIFVQATESKIYQPVSKMIESTMQWGLLALGSALVAAAVFARILANPIKRLAEATRAFSRRDFSARVEVRSITEVGELADTFNRMAADLEDYIRRLKQAAAENNELFLGTARALASAIDAKDPYTRGHSVRVNRYAVILARYHGLSEHDIADIHVASLLHDVGKIGVDDAILKKPGKLTPEEFEVMKLHPVIGANIMAPIRQMKRLLPGLRSHHERWMGEGYPDRLKGNDIPLMARIIAVADTFDAMTTDRPYQNAMSFEKALARLNELKGSGFDEHIVESFNRAYVAGEFTRQPQQQPQPQLAASVREPAAV
jgi:HD-GYP domain-containing protein (c-di-GMP phosphodiesterase class II)